MIIEEDNNPNFERRLDQITAGLDPFIRKHLLERISRTNATTIIDYIEAYTFESNPKPYSKQVAILTLKQLSEHHKNAKSFRDMSREDILVFLNRLRKTDEKDPLHHWIGTYNNNVITLRRFFKWLYYSELEPSRRPRGAGGPMQNVGKINRKEKTIYKDSDLWLDLDCNRIFFKHVTSVRDRAFHAIMLDTSCRPKELIGAKIKDLEFKDSGYNQKFAYLWVTGKSGQRIKKLIVKSLPYLRDWLSHGHPRPEDSNSYIFCGYGKRNLGHKLKKHTFSHIYIRYRKKLFPSLLNSSEVSAEDKQIIKEKILTKPIRPYILRHTSLTEKSQIIGEYELRQHADWTMTSNMPQRYLHFAGNESVKAQLKAQGIISTNEGSTAGSDGGDIVEQTALRSPLICSNCREQNKPDAQFCANPKCGMVLSFKANSESIVSGEKIIKRVSELEARLSDIQLMFSKLNEGKKQLEENFQRMIKLNG